MYDPKLIVKTELNRLKSMGISEIFRCAGVTAVKSIDLDRGAADLVVELSGLFKERGDINRTSTKTLRLDAVLLQRGSLFSISAGQILLNPKVRHIQSLKLSECHRSVLVNPSVMANLKNLESLDLSDTQVSIDSTYELEVSRSFWCR
jgi:hypothetical protein